MNETRRQHLRDDPRIPEDFHFHTHYTSIPSDHSMDKRVRSRVANVQGSKSDIIINHWPTKNSTQEETANVLELSLETRTRGEISGGNVRIEHGHDFCYVTVTGNSILTRALSFPTSPALN